MKWFRERLCAKIIKGERQELSNEERTEILRKTVELDRCRFQRAMSSVHSLFLGAITDMEKAAIYDFAIWAIGRDVAADGCSNLMLGKNVQENRDISYAVFPDIPEARGGSQVVDLAKCNAYTGCWNPNRILTSVGSLFESGYHQPSDSNGVYYPELRFAIMYNGRHHTSLATFLNDCKVNLEVIQLTPYFNAVNTDGAFYDYLNEYNEPQHIRIGEYRMAVLFQLAKERARIEQTHIGDLFTREMMHKHLQEESKQYDRLCDALKEVSYWKQQCTVKDQRIRELEGNSFSSK